MNIPFPFVPPNEISFNELLNDLRDSNGENINIYSSITGKKAVMKEAYIYPYHDIIISDGIIDYLITKEEINKIYKAELDGLIIWEVNYTDGTYNSIFINFE